MNYTVLWRPVAEQRLASIWMTARDRNAVTEAAHAIDEVLRIDPEQVGESRPDDVRIHFEEPLGILFTVSPDDRMAYVLSVWRWDSR
jgi:hypothetical protein